MIINQNHSLMEFFAEEISLLKPKLVSYLNTKNSYINSIILETFMSHGKFLRPRMFFASSHLFSYTGPTLFELAAVCEYIHCASLLHDDVIDDAKLRRNKPTLNALCDNKTAVLLGDLIYSTACRLMVKSQSLEVIDCFAECIRSMSESELYQTNLLWNPATKIDDYFFVIKGKTSNLFSASLSSPGVMSGANANTITLLKKYGEYIGYIFQITDDCLDFSGDVLSIGKLTNHDIEEGKFTLPILLALQDNNPYISKLTSELFVKKSVSPDEIKTIVEIIQEKGYLNKAKDIAYQYAIKCQSLFNDKEWSKFNLANNNFFSNIPFELIERSH